VGPRSRSSTRAQTPQTSSSPMCARPNETDPGVRGAPWPLNRGLPALLDEHVLQPHAERVEFQPPRLAGPEPRRLKWQCLALSAQT
jgi:hypothetical protein